MMPHDFPVLTRQFERDLILAKRKPKTIRAYGDAVRLFGVFLDSLPEKATTDEMGNVVRPGAVKATAKITRTHCKHFFGWLRERGSRRNGQIGDALSESYLNHLYRGIQAFWKWMVVEEFAPSSPMAHVPLPQPEDVPPPVIPLDVAQALVATCGKGRNRVLRDVRDEAMLRLFIDTGIRCAEMQFPRDMLDMNRNKLRVVGKGSKTRDVTFGNRTGKALDYYLYARPGDDKMMWLGERGPMTVSGIYQMVVRRGKMIDLDLNPHMFRHTFAHEFRLAGGSDTDLMYLMGWESESMCRRYGKSAQAERAHHTHTQLSLGDRI